MFLSCSVLCLSFQCATEAVRRRRTLDGCRRPTLEPFKVLSNVVVAIRIERERESDAIKNKKSRKRRRRRRRREKNEEEK